MKETLKVLNWKNYVNEALARFKILFFPLNRGIEGVEFGLSTRVEFILFEDFGFDHSTRIKKKVC